MGVPIITSPPVIRTGSEVRSMRWMRSLAYASELRVHGYRRFQRSDSRMSYVENSRLFQIFAPTEIPKNPP